MKETAAAWLFLVALLEALPARAIPVDRVLTLTPGQVHFERVGTDVEPLVEPSDLATVELFPTGELLVTPLHKGRGLIYLTGADQLQVLRLEVRAADAQHLPPSPDLSSLVPICTEVFTDSQVSDNSATRTDYEPSGTRYGANICMDCAPSDVGEETMVLHVHIQNQACRLALEQLFAGDAWTADRLRVVYEVPALQAQLRDMQARLAEANVSGVQLAYAGPTLTLRGHADAATRRKILRVLWPEALGRLAFDDQLDPQVAPAQALPQAPAQAPAQAPKDPPRELPHADP